MRCHDVGVHGRVGRRSSTRSAGLPAAPSNQPLRATRRRSSQPAARGVHPGPCRWVVGQPSRWIRWVGTARWTWRQRNWSVPAQATPPAYASSSIGSRAVLVMQQAHQLPTREGHRRGAGAMGINGQVCNLPSSVSISRCRCSLLRRLVPVRVPFPHPAFSIRAGLLLAAHAPAPLSLRRRCGRGVSWARGAVGGEAHSLRAAAVVHGGHRRARRWWRMAAAHGRCPGRV